MLVVAAFNRKTRKLQTGSVYVCLVMSDQQLTLLEYIKYAKKYSASCYILFSYNLPLPTYRR